MPLWGKKNPRPPAQPTPAGLALSEQAARAALVHEAVLREQRLADQGGGSARTRQDALDLAAEAVAWVLALPDQVRYTMRQQQGGERWFSTTAELIELRRRALRMCAVLDWISTNPPSDQDELTVLTRLAQVDRDLARLPVLGTMELMSAQDWQDLCARVDAGTFTLPAWQGYRDELIARHRSRWGS